MADGQLREELAQAEREARKVGADQLLRCVVEELTPHPYNPARRHETTAEGLTQLADSLREKGVLEPLIVARAAAVLSHAPALAEVILPESWVILAGHRRWAAARQAGIPKVPVVVRDDLADPASITEVFLQENLHRDAITAVEEARAYRRLLDEQELSQRAIATRTGVSQSHVSKSLALLDLPEGALTAIDDGALPVATARRLLDLPADERNKAWDKAGHADLLEQAVRKQLEQLQHQQAREEAEQRLAHEQVDQINPHGQFGQELWAHRLRTEAEVAEAREAGALAGASIDQRGSVTYYASAPREDTLTVNTPPTKSARQPRQRAHVIETEAAHQDHERRLQACRGILGDFSSLLAGKRSALNQIMIRALLSPTQLRPGRAELAPLGIELGTDEQLYGLAGTKQAHRAALATALLQVELDLYETDCNAPRGWKPSHRDHVQQLISLGYHNPSDHEHERLNSPSDGEERDQ